MRRDREVPTAARHGAIRLRRVQGHGEDLKRRRKKRAISPLAGAWAHEHNEPSKAGIYHSLGGAEKTQKPGKTQGNIGEVPELADRVGLENRLDGITSNLDPALVAPKFRS
jgi:hypothetical protein